MTHAARMARGRIPLDPKRRPHARVRGRSRRYGLADPRVRVSGTTPSPDYEGPRQQAAIFLLPHLAILSFAPELWGILPIVFVGALMFGWIRIKSGSILGSWLMHASGNVTMALMVAVRTSS